MAPRRNNSNHHSGTVVDVHNLMGFNVGVIGDQQQQHPQSQQDHFNNNNNNSFETSSQIMSMNGGVGVGMGQGNLNEAYTRCCVPVGECLLADPLSDVGLINMDNLSECVRVICNNENCTAGQYMHRDCFEAWEQTILNVLKSTGRARSWPDRQRAQNLWTKKGYDLVYKQCGCKCSRGHLRKDLDWSPPINNNVFGRIDEEATKKKKKRNRNNQKQSLTISTINPGVYHPNSQINHMTPNNNNNHIGTNDLRGRASSLSSSNGTTSPPVSASTSEHSISPIHHNSNNNNNNMIINTNNINNNDFNNINGNITIGNKHMQLMQYQHQQQQQQHQQQQQQQLQQASQPQEHDFSMLTPFQQQQLAMEKKNQEVELYSKRVRFTSGCNGIFSRRLDFSSFNLLPKTRLNSYQVKIEDEGNHGNDETRLFILSSLAQSQKSRVACILCEAPMFVFDRYPLVEGSFFLSPKQHSPGCIEVKHEGRAQFLTAVCMGCLNGNSSNRAIYCRFCGDRWNGSSLVLGTMYSYDIFAAMPCCAERLKCNACFKLLLHPQQRLNFYSDYSHCVACPYCNTQDAHFVKPIAYCYTKQAGKLAQQLP